MTAHGMLDALGKIAPFLLNVALPGSALVVLLLWLSVRYVRTGFGAVRQFLCRPMLFRPVITAKPHRGRKSLCLCRGHTVILNVWPNGFRQMCR